MHVVALCRYNVTRIEGTEVPFTFCRWSWDTVYTSSNVWQQRKLLFDGTTTVAVLAIEFTKNLWVMGQHLVTHSLLCSRHLEQTANWRRRCKFTVSFSSTVKTFFISAIISWFSLLTSPNQWSLQWPCHLGHFKNSWLDWLIESRSFRVVVCRSIPGDATTWPHCGQWVVDVHLTSSTRSLISLLQKGGYASR